MRYLDVKRTKKKEVKKKSPIFKAIFLVLLGLVVAGMVWARSLSPMSVFSKIINPSGLKQTDGRINILLLGLDTRPDRPSSTLTDTVIVGSIDNEGKNATLISIPRDLWVPIDDDYSGKINSAYAIGEADQDKIDGGITLAKEKVEEVLGIPIHYYALINFEGFKKAIDILGGIEVDVENTFDDYHYPIPGREEDTCGITEDPIKIEDGKEATQSAEEIYLCRYDHLHFDKGLTKMDGETALRYARSRYAVGVEGGDFARAKRQQKVIIAAKNKLLSLPTLLNPGKLKELYDAYGEFVETDLGISEGQRLLEISQKLERETIKNAVIDKDSELVVSPIDSDPYLGASVLIPKGGDFSQIQAFIQRLLFE